jgi:hypothetical protein
MVDKNNTLILFEFSREFLKPAENVEDYSRPIHACLSKPNFISQESPFKVHGSDIPCCK